jgi:glycosyltransferase involved in cell wall biosynthesis
MTPPDAGFRPSLAHRAWRLLPPRARRKAISRLTALVAPHPDTTPPAPGHGIVVAGEISRASGLGEGARLMLEGARRLGLPASPLDVDTPIGGGRQIEPPTGPSPADRAPLVVHVNAPFLPLAMCRVGSRLLRRRFVAGYWAWELPVVPPEWKVGIPFVHEVWTPSRFSAAALEPLLPGRIRVVPPPLAIVPPVPSALDRQGLGLPHDAVIVLLSFNLASSFVRKNPLGAIAAFRQAFGDRTDRLLVVKIANADHFPQDARLLTEAVAGARNIRIDTRLLPPADHAALLAAADIVIALHRSEGLGLVAAEAMLLGRPVVATDWSGNLEFMDADSAALVPVRLVPPADPRGVLYGKGARWADPDLGVAAEHLRRLADDAPGRTALGARGQAMAKARLGLGGLEAALRGIGVPLDPDEPARAETSNRQ